MFSTLPVAVGDEKLAAMRNSFSVTLSASHIDFDTVGIDINRTNFKGRAKRDANITIEVTSIDGDYELLKWNGCDAVSDDLKTCKIFHIDSDKTIIPFVVPKTIEVKSGIVIRDISKAYSKIDSNASTSDLYVIEVFSDIGDTNTSQTFADMQAGDIVVHSKEPVYFGKLKTKSKINDFRYRISLEKVPLESVITQGYIASKALKNGAYTSASGVKVLSKSVILPNGKKLDFDPNEPASITIDFKDGIGKVRATAKAKSVKITKTENGYKYSTDDLGIPISGTLTIVPKNKFGISWGFFSGLEQLYLEVGVELKNNLNISAEGEWKVDKEIPLKEYMFVQTIAVGPIPVVINEPIKIYLGLNAEAKASAEFDNTASVTPTFKASWSKSAGAKSDLVVSQTLDTKANVQGAFDSYAFVGVFPRLEIYGIGAGIDNRFGPYFNISGEANAEEDVVDSKVKIAAGLSGSYGLKYEGTINLTSSWDLVQEQLDQINEALGESAKITKTWQYDAFEYEAKYYSNPGYISMDGKKFVSIEKTAGESLEISEDYTLENKGDSPVYWTATIFTSDVNLDARFSDGKYFKTGRLNGGEKVDLTMIASQDELALKEYEITLKIVESDKPIRSSMLTEKVAGTSIVAIHVVPQELSFATTSMDVDIVGTTIKRMHFSWEKRSDYDLLDGYHIYIATYDAEEDTCVNFTPFAEQASSAKTTAESDDLTTLAEEGVIESGKEYCFMLTGYKTYTAATGEEISREYTLSDTPLKFTPLPKIEVEETPDDGTTTFTKELDIMFVVDVSGSYSDDIETFKSKSLDIISSIQSRLPEDTVLKVGVSSFSDYPEYGGIASDYAYKLNQKLVYDANGSLFENAINHLTILNGGDGPESQLEALYNTASSKDVGWSPGAMKLILLFTDASFHNSDSESSYPGHGFSEVRTVLDEKNIAVIGLGSNSISDDLESISAYTFLLDSASSEVVDAVVSIIESIPGSTVFESPARFINRSKAFRPVHTDPAN